MSKLVIDVEMDEKFLKDNCMIVFRKEKWQVVTRDSFIGEFVQAQNDKNNQYEQRIKKIEDNLLKLAQIVKEK
jgi:hypothetical protein